MKNLKKYINQLKNKTTIEKDNILYKTELNIGRKKLEKGIPNELADFYYEADGGIFFKDIEFEQWGMKIYPFDELRTLNEYVRTWKEYLLSSDIVVAEFLGDLDLLTISCDSKDYGQVIVAIPIYERKDWYFLNMNFTEFLEKYIENEGEKFWENISIT